jgi:ferredoxin--NADP+ reductase
MFEILQKKELTQNIFLMELKAPLIAKKVKSGQFLIIRVDEDGERFPLTVADFDRDAGTVTIIYHAIGQSTQKLASLNVGESPQDVVGPLGKPSHFEQSVKKAAVIGGGLGCAIAYPQAKYLHSRGVSVDMIAGFRTKDIIILEDEMKKVCDNLYLATDDGSYGEHGFVTDVLKRLIESGVKYDVVVAIGPLPMMKFVSLLTKQYGIPTIVSMNPIMIDGTGMCGGCRLTVGGETKFACVDGPDFDGHQVDFDEAMRRLSSYDHVREENCKLEGMH